MCDLCDTVTFFYRFEAYKGSAARLYRCHLADESILVFRQFSNFFLIVFRYFYEGSPSVNTDF